MSVGGWRGYTSLVSPGGGLYHRRDGNGVVSDLVAVQASTGELFLYPGPIDKATLCLPRTEPGRRGQPSPTPHHPVTPTPDR